MRALVTGATGFVGTRLAEALAGQGHDVRALVRSASSAHALRPKGYEPHVGDLSHEESIRGAGEEVDVAYYLVHAMAGGGDFERREAQMARNFGRMAGAERVGRVVYLGGLGGEAVSRHLRSRHHTAEILQAEGPRVTYFRAAMVVGAGSESYRTLRYLVERLPVMIAPAWLETDTQPIGIDDVVAYLSRAPAVAESRGREVQIGGPDVLSYGDMLDRMALALGKRPRIKIPVPVLSPRLSSLWLGLVTPIDTNVARPLVEGLVTETVVTDLSGAEPFDIVPASFDETLRRAIAEADESHS